jgi:hypothetical protein
MTNEDRRLIVETLGEMRELKGEMRGFKKHAIERVQDLEKRGGTEQATAVGDKYFDFIGCAGSEYHR